MIYAPILLVEDECLKRMRITQKEYGERRIVLYNRQLRTGILLITLNGK